MKLIREPLLHFLIIGAAIYLVYGLFAVPSAEQAGKTITVTAGEIEWLQSAWQKRWSRPPTDSELDGLIQQYLQETILYQEARAMGLEQNDPVVRRRLAQKMEFLAEDLVDYASPEEKELRAYFTENAQRYTPPVLYTFSQVFVDPDKHGDATLDEAKRIREKLIAEDIDVEKAGALGDDIMLQTYYPQKDRIEIQKQFGSGFTESLLKLSPGQWHGPVLSGYGVHLVYVSHIGTPPSPIFSEVRDRVLQDWKAEQREKLKAEFFAALREQYTVIIEKPKSSDKLATLQTRAQVK